MSTLKTLFVVLLLAGVSLPDAYAQITFRAAASASTAMGSPNITHLGAGTAATRNNCGNINPSIPAGSNGDMLIALVNVREYSAAVSMPGWSTLYFDQYPGLAGGAEMKVFIFWRFATGGDPNTVTQSGTCSSIAAQISRFSGVHATQPFENTPIPPGNVARQNTGYLDTGTETTTLDASMILVAGFINDDRTVTEGAGWNQSFDTSLNVSRDLGLSLHYQLQASASFISISNWDLSGAGTDPNYGIIFALRPAAPPSGLTVNVPAGTATGDVMIASIGVRPCSLINGGACTVTVPTPFGWTLVNSVDQTTGAGTGGFGNRLFVFRRVATGAEPANYTWVFGGTPTHDGAVGAISSFTDVDPVNPIVVDAGQATPNSYTHDAPGIDTGTEIETMLVSTHTANSSATWSPPGGMTESADVSSLAAPDNLGVSLQMNYEEFLPAGATGTRTATHSNPPASDTGATHMLALRPFAGGGTPGGGFNAFETGTPPGSVVGVLKTKVAGAAFSFDIVSLNPDATIDTSYRRVVQVELLDASDNSGTLDAEGCRSTWINIFTLIPDPRFRASDNGRITVGPFTVADAYPNVRVRVTNVTGGARRGCSTDNFAIRPNAFTAFSVSDDGTLPLSAAAGTARALNDVTFGTIRHKAGRPVSVRANAVNAAGIPAITTNYTGSPTPTLTVCGGAACTASFGTFTLGAAFATGQLITDVASYSEVGSFSLQLIDDTFAAVDSADGSSVAEMRIQSAVIDVGRFVPDHFAVSLNTPSFTTACAAGAFTYVGQTFDYATAPVITLQARNFSNNPTTLYTGSWWRITSASLTGKAYAAASGTLDTTGVPGTDPVIFNAGSGSGSLTFSSGTGLLFTRTTPALPFDADIGLAINLIDLDSVAAPVNPVTFGAGIPGNGIAFTAGKEMRFGRLRLPSDSGSQQLPLQLTLQTQYWASTGAGASFITNTDDSCTALAAANIAMGNYQRNLAACETSLTVGGFSSGRATAQLSPPGSGNAGSVDLTVNLGASGSGSTCIAGSATPVTGANRVFLQGGAAYDQNPVGRAAFGVYRGSDEVIHIRENY